MSRRDPVREWFAKDLTDEEWEAAYAGIRAHNDWRDKQNGLGPEGIKDHKAWSRDVARYDAAAIHFWEVWAVVNAALEEWMSGPRITEETLQVLAAIAYLGEATPTQIRSRTGLASGTVSPILKRLEEVGWLSHRNGSSGSVVWQVVAGSAAGERVMKLYTLMRELADSLGYDVGPPSAREEDYDAR